MNITEEFYVTFVTTKKKSSADLLEEFDKKSYIEKCQILDLEHMIKGIVSEAGELCDAVKKHTAYGKELDMENIREELGDLEFFLEGFRQIFNIKREEIICENIQKLSKRYKESYTNEEAVLRNDKI